jgi:hypothetical protein
MKQKLPIDWPTRANWLPNQVFKKLELGAVIYFFNSGFFLNNRKLVGFFYGQISARTSPPSIISSSS